MGWKKPVSGALPWGIALALGCASGGDPNLGHLPPDPEPSIAGGVAGAGGMVLVAGAAGGVSVAGAGGDPVMPIAGAGGDPMTLVAGTAGDPTMPIAGTAGDPRLPESGTAGAPMPPTQPLDGASFPRSGEPVNVALQGPYSFQTTPMTDPDWADATLYYPTNAPEPFAAMMVAPGFTETKEAMTWWAEMLASHGFAVLSTTPVNTFTDQPPDRATDLETAVRRIREENARAGSPVEGKIAIDRLALSGHSMGGGGTVWAASALGDEIRAAVPLMPHTPYITDADMKAITAPTLYVAGELDPDLLGGPNLYSIPHFNSMTPSVDRGLMIFRGGDHFIGVNGGDHHDVVARYAVAWLKIYLEEDDRYRTYVYGEDHDPTPFSTYMTAP